LLRATVYNCLKLFAEKKLLQEVVVHRDTVTAPHAHVYNVDTGELCDLEAGLGVPKLPVGTVVEGAHLVWLVRSGARQNGLAGKVNSGRVKAD
jgi:Fur family transcriptional regulator, iron response regulator